MRRLNLLAACGLALLAAGAARADLDPRPVLVEPGVIGPGQTINLRWYFTGTKVMLSGGRFGKGTIVTGKSSISDHPLKTTKYTFDVWYRPAPDPAKPDDKPELKHLQYNAVAAVDKLTSYRSSQGWNVSYLKGWRTDTYSPEPGSKIFYFQPEEDSVERLAVAVIPAKADQTSADLMQSVRADVPSHYTNVEFLSQYDITHQKEAAQLTTFRGIDQSHPQTRTETVILALVRNGRAYVISARTYANRFQDRQALMEGLVRSLNIGGSTQNASAKNVSSK
jgi:hypothetical protein